MPVAVHVLPPAALPRRNARRHQHFGHRKVAKDAFCPTKISLSRPGQRCAFCAFTCLGAINKASAFQREMHKLAESKDGVKKDSIQDTWFQNSWIVYMWSH